MRELPLSCSAATSSKWLQWMRLLGVSSLEATARDHRSRGAKAQIVTLGFYGAVGNLAHLQLYHNVEKM
jgi:hypothetical protein